MLANGTLLQGRYRIIRLLARGGMGAVYEAEAVHLGNATVAVKQTFYSEQQRILREQFEREAAMMARLRHPALPKVSDHFVEGGMQFLVMEFIPGDDLFAAESAQTVLRLRAGDGMGRDAARRSRLYSHSTTANHSPGHQAS